MIKTTKEYSMLINIYMNIEKRKKVKKTKNKTNQILTFTWVKKKIKNGEY